VAGSRRDSGADRLREHRAARTQGQCGGGGIARGVGDPACRQRRAGAIRRRAPKL